MGAKKIISIITISLLAIVVAVLSVYVVIFKDKENKLAYSLNKDNDDESIVSSQEKDETKFNFPTPIGG